MPESDAGALLPRVKLAGALELLPKLKLPGADPLLPVPKLGVAPPKVGVIPALPAAEVNKPPTLLAAELKRPPPETAETLLAAALKRPPPEAEEPPNREMPANGLLEADAVEKPKDGEGCGGRLSASSCESAGRFI